MVSLPDLLEFCRNTMRTGTLSFQSGESMGTVKLRRGKIIDAASPRITPLLKRLLDSGITSQEQLTAITLSNENDPDGGDIAELLVDSGFADLEEVRKTVLIHAQTAVKELIGWVDGRFAFHPEEEEEESDLSEPKAGIDPQVVLLRIFKEQDEAAR